jgi:hypothetical protein
MTRALVLNTTTGNLETSAILPHIALRPELHYKDGNPAIVAQTAVDRVPQ